MKKFSTRVSTAGRNCYCKSPGDYQVEDICNFKIRRKSHDAGKTFIFSLFSNAGIPEEHSFHP
jgi:hypothetical protein